MDLGQKIKLYRLEFGWTQEDLAAKSNISIQSIKRYETGKGDNITTANLEKLASVFNVSLTDFLNNSIVRKSNENLVRKSFVSSDISPKKSQNLQKLRTLIDEQENKIINLRFFPSVSAAAGYGTSNDDETYELIPIAAKFLTKVLRVPVRQYDLISIFGDSMEPIIKNGDTLLVEPTHEARNGEIVIANISGDLYVKKLLRDPINREVKLTSMNELYKDIVMSGDELEMLKIIGIVRKVVPLGVLSL
ncbi:signal peptidase I [Campylobacter hyointestinalis subsp. hyointestinalis]|uniref:Signal peptidase I n=1 Tax=Campylobacter hyointestinalis subsp. hyointestinalis TaxID=91352 RepID=A0A0S4SRP9_CAMHY|nr:XRE family transcriptional regulator [Campylobacter hyointestinalis]CUU88197.1 signal peptidase I [Campylobacter hyointestinalis subsp. hyointestinalis]